MHSKLFFLTILAFSFTLISCGTKPDEGRTADDSAGAMENTTMAADMAHNSRNSLDWAGVYTGTLPCADCSGIKTMIELNDDGTYTMKTRYLGEPDEVYTSTGDFSWNDAGSKITLEGGKDQAPMMYQVGENVLFHLDQDGNRITGELADNYRLTKAQKSLVGKRWKLVEILGKPVAEMELAGEPFIRLTGEAEGWRLSGNDGCNNFTGTYEMGDGNTISFSPLASTGRACIKGDLQQQMTGVFKRADNYTLNEDGTMLSLNRARMAPLARFEVDYMNEE